MNENIDKIVKENLLKTVNIYLSPKFSPHNILRVNSSHPLLATPRLGSSLVGVSD